MRVAAYALFLLSLPAAADYDAKLGTAGDTLTLDIPYIESIGTPKDAYTARLTSRGLPDFALDPWSLRATTALSGLRAPATFGVVDGKLTLDLPLVEFAIGITTQLWSARLSSSDLANFTVDQATPGPAWAASGGACRPAVYESSAQTVLAGALKIEFEDIAGREGMQHLRFSNLSGAPIFFTLTVSSDDGRVGLMAPQPGQLYLNPGESRVGYLLYYGTGVAGPATYRLRFDVAGLDTSSGRSNGQTESFERTASFVRASEQALTITDAATQLAFDRVKQVSTQVGFWRYKVDAAETRIVLFPGQENWPQASAAASAKVLAYNMDGDLLWEFSPGWEVWGGDMSTDGKYVAFATVARVGIASSTLYLLDAATGALLASRTLKVGELPSPAGAIPPTTAETDAREVRFSPDGRYLAVGTSEGRGYLFASEGLVPLVAVQTGGQLRAIAYRDDAIYLGAGDGLLQRIPLDGGAAWQGYTTAWPYNEPKFSPEGSQVVVGAKSGGFVVLDAKTGACVFSANFGTVRDAFFTPDGAYLVAATGAFSAGTIVYRTADWSFAFSGSMAAAASVTADSRYLLMADGKAMLFDLTSGQRVATLDPGFAANANYFKTAYVSKDGSRVVVARRDLTPGEVAIVFFRRR